MSARLCCAAVAFLVLGLVTGCGSDKDSGDQARSAPSKAATDSGQDAAQARAAKGAALAPADPPIDAAELARVAALDPDDAIGRYRQECNARDQSHRCRALRRRVEHLFLDALVTLRAGGETLDPRLYRVAARAENPRLIMVGLRGLLLGPGPISEEDEQLIVAGLDSPYAGIRQTVLQLAGGLLPVKTVTPRVAIDADRSSSFPYLDESRGREPDLAVAGSYPGARYRHFASNATRHWFTTPDPLEKVIAFLTRDGKQALTADAFQAKAGADMQQAYVNAMMTGDEKKIAQAMQQMTLGGVDWTSTLRNVSGAGEIRYITLAPDRVIAVFADDVLRATSIVAPVPSPVPHALRADPQRPLDYEKLAEDMQKTLEQESRIRQVLGR